MSTKRLDLLMNILKIGLGGLGVILCIMLLKRIAMVLK
jgi:hypothetical protein